MDKLLDYFGVKNHHELTKYIRSNPTDPKVLELKELMKEFNINVDEGREDKDE